MALLITLFYLILFGIGALVGMFFGYPFIYSLFESTSAGANIGLSCGITQPGMPVALKITYILQMWLGRLEFMSVFTLLGFFLCYDKRKAMRRITLIILLLMGHCSWLLFMRMRRQYPARS